MKKMKSIIIIALVILGLIYILFYKYMPPYNQTKTVRLLSGLKIPHETIFVKDTSFYSFTGEGYTEIVIKLNNDQYKTLLRKNDLEEFKNLPIKEKLPEEITEEYYNYMDIDTLNKYYFNLNDSLKRKISGYYKLKKYEYNKSFKITIIDKIKLKILIYSFND